MAYPSPPSPHRMANGAALFFHLALVLAVANGEYAPLTGSDSDS